MSTSSFGYRIKKRKRISNCFYFTFSVNLIFSSTIGIVNLSQPFCTALFRVSVGQMIVFLMTHSRSVFFSMFYDNIPYFHLDEKTHVPASWKNIVKLCCRYIYFNSVLSIDISIHSTFHFHFVARNVGGTGSSCDCDVTGTGAGPGSLCTSDPWPSNDMDSADFPRQLQIYSTLESS